jgi:arylsulfatase A-like enzyme
LQGRVAQIYPEVYGYWHRPELTAPLPVQRMVRSERWKLIYYSNVDRYQLFDLANDPYELKDLSADPAQAETKGELRAKLDAWFKPRLENLPRPVASPKSESL